MGGGGGEGWKSQTFDEDMSVYQDALLNTLLPKTYVCVCVCVCRCVYTHKQHTYTHLHLHLHTHIHTHTHTQHTHTHSRYCALLEPGEQLCSDGGVRCVFGGGYRRAQGGRVEAG